MTRNSKLFLAAGLLTVLNFPALAQSNPHNRSRPQPQAGYYGQAMEPTYPGTRRDQTYSRPRGYTGTIYWNTPNADGNFGGPGAGGAGPGG